MPYSTKQQRSLLRCLRERSQEALTAGELAAALHEAGEPVGLATIYRQLDKLEADGRIHKIRTAEGACYQYCPNDSGQDCFLLRCRACGHIQHLECSHFQELYQHIAEEHHFQIDSRHTVLTGLCERCARQQREETHEQ